MINLLPAFILVLVGCAVYSRFIFGDGILLYKDIGSDSLISYYPDFVHLSRYIREEGFPSWSFYIGMGQDLAYATGYLLWEPVSWLPKEWIAPALIFQHLAKALLVGLLFDWYLRLRGLTAPARFVGCLALAFSGYMAIASSGYFPFADEVIALVAVLVGIELVLKKGQWLVLVIGVAVVGMINPFYLYLCALLLVAYVPITLVHRFRGAFSRILRMSLPIGVIALLGVIAGAAITLPFLEVILHSPRGSGAVTNANPLRSFPILGFESPLHYATALFRLFSTDLLGTGDAFHGWQNFLEAPLTYCGLLPLLLLPQSYCHRSLRDRVIITACLVTLIVPTVFPWFRYLFWLFQGDYYRTYSLFWILATLFLGLSALSGYSSGKKLNLTVLGGTTLLLLAVLFLPIIPPPASLNTPVRNAALVYIVAYTFLLLVGQLLRRERVATWLIAIIAAIELTHFNYVTVSHRSYVTKAELYEKTGYNDPTVDALHDIKAADKTFFRITKPRPSAPTNWYSYNDAMVFGYYGTSSYSSFNNVNYTDFLTATASISSGTEAQTRWALGLVDNPLLATFACEKYALLDEPSIYEKILSYRFVAQYGRDSLLVNQFYLPFGLSFTGYITQREFETLSLTDRSRALLACAVLSENQSADGLTHLTIPELQSGSRDIPLRYVIEARRNSALKLTSFAQSRIEGELRVVAPAALVLQTPYDSGWRAFVDGRPATARRLDAGLLGLTLTPGEHRITFLYRNRLLLPGVILTVFAVLLVAFGWWRYRRIPLLIDDGVT